MMGLILCFKFCYQFILYIPMLRVFNATARYVNQAGLVARALSERGGGDVIHPSIHHPSSIARAHSAT